MTPHAAHDLALRPARRPGLAATRELRPSATPGSADPEGFPGSGLTRKSAALFFRRVRGGSELPAGPAPERVGWLGVLLGTEGPAAPVLEGFGGLGVSLGAEEPDAPVLERFGWLGVLLGPEVLLAAPVFERFGWLGVLVGPDLPLTPGFEQVGWFGPQHPHPAA